MKKLLILATLALLVVLIFWAVKRYLNKRKEAKFNAVRPDPKKFENAPVAAASQKDELPVQAKSSFQASESVPPVADRRQAEIVDRRSRAIEEQKAAVRDEAPAIVAETARAEPVPAVVHEKTPAAATETAEAPKAGPAPAPAREEPSADWLPEDSVLKRHYLTHLRAEREALTNPYPTDSTLRRHYETMIRMELDWPSAQASREEAPVPQESAARERPVIQGGKPEAKAEPLLTVVRSESHAHAAHGMRIPEDSILRRHFLTNLQAEVESELPARPTDSVLKRHYDALVSAKMAERLERHQV